ncbi:DUF21 domain-containing protein At1g55930, chloroplastic-like [Pistacia vera]|uniref:DUF21 domain-containing protein At1g55930, chloroplastic-like n=1 Tax=Pistacia vera TaxID=55513 RepID=UPI0012639C8B|nr:DUF21 domain-containing protein At1g55930, chloroplastic-like [Pistacia vera]
MQWICWIMSRRSGDFYSSSSLSEVNTTFFIDFMRQSHSVQNYDLSILKVDLLESTTVGDMAHKPAYFIPDSMTIWNLLREFHIRKVHMAVVLNEYGGTVGVVSLEDVVEEIVGEIVDENDSKEKIQKKTAYIVMRAEGIYDVDAITSIDQLSEDLNIKVPEGHQYETVSGFICEAFGCIPRTGESMKVVLEKENQEENEEHYESGSDLQTRGMVLILLCYIYSCGSSITLSSGYKFTRIISRTFTFLLLYLAYIPP